MTGTTVWKVDGTQLTLNGDPFYLKGVCYSPTPIGYATFTPQIGDWFYDKCAVLWRSQYPDDRGDLKTMAGLGVNHLRTYFWWNWQWPTDSVNWVLNKGWKNADAATFDQIRARIFDTKSVFSAFFFQQIKITAPCFAKVEIVADD